MSEVFNKIDGDTLEKVTTEKVTRKELEGQLANLKNQVLTLRGRAKSIQDRLNQLS